VGPTSSRSLSDSCEVVVHEASKTTRNLGTCSMASKRSGGVYSNATREGLDWSPMTCDLAPDIPA